MQSTAEIHQKTRSHNVELLNVDGDRIGRKAIKDESNLDIAAAGERSRQRTYYGLI